jgi:MazG family protein
MSTPIDRLLAVMARLRHPETGCAWDLKQTSESLASHTLEEAYEVIDAIERKDAVALRDELGDLLFQIVFYAEIAKNEAKASEQFTFDDIVEAIIAKLVRRHPHVFSGAAHPTGAAQAQQWEDIKAAEKAATGRASSVLDDVPLALPALSRAVKLSRRAARIGFDWPDAEGPWAKVQEELVELADARARGAEREVTAELGDVLLAVANLARHLQIDPESALRGANQRFESRFRHVEQEGARTQRHDLSSLESYWRAAKLRETQGQ